MANNPGVTTGGGKGILSHLDGSDAAAGAAEIWTVKKAGRGQNLAVVVDGDYGDYGDYDDNDDGVVVHVKKKVGLKIGRNNAVVWGGGGNCNTSTKKTSMPSSSSATGSAQYDEHDDYGDGHHDVVVVGPGIGVMNLAHSNTITTDTSTMKKEKKKDGPAVKNTILLRGSSKPLACCVM